MYMILVSLDTNTVKMGINQVKNLFSFEYIYPAYWVCGKKVLTQIAHNPLSKEFLNGSRSVSVDN